MPTWARHWERSRDGDSRFSAAGPSLSLTLVIRFSHVYKSYPNGALALKDVSFRVGKGEFVFLTGHSGAGKSTIMKMLFAEQQPTVG